MIKKRRDNSFIRAYALHIKCLPRDYTAVKQVLSLSTLSDADPWQTFH